MGNIVIRDRSGAQLPGTIQPNLGGNRLSTSDPVANQGARDAFVGDGKQGNRSATIPEKVKPLSVPEVATSEDEPTPTCAVTAGSETGSVSQDNPAVKSHGFQGSVGPRLSKVEAGRVIRQGISKVSVATHPQITRAHQTGSITSKDAHGVHGRTPLKAATPGNPPDTAEADQGGPMPQIDKGSTNTEMDVALDQPGKCSVAKAQGSAMPSGSDQSAGLHEAPNSRDGQLDAAHKHSTLDHSDHVSLHQGAVLAPLKKPVSDSVKDSNQPVTAQVSGPAALGVTKTVRETAISPVVADLGKSRPMLSRD